MENGWAVYNKRTGVRMSPIFQNVDEAQDARVKYAAHRIYWDDPATPLVHTIVRRVVPTGRCRVYD